MNKDEIKACRFIVQNEGIRLDRFIAQKMNLSRSEAQNYCKQGLALINKKSAKCSSRIEIGDEITCVLINQEPKTVELMAEDISIDIVYKDEDLLVVNKRKNMVMHPSKGHESGTLANALLFHFPDIKGGEDLARPGMLHRIDKDTSGLVLIARNQHSFRFLKEQVINRSMERLYYALVEGNIKENGGTIDAKLGRNDKNRKKYTVRQDGRPAVTHYKVLERFGEFTLLECKLETGRTHQIRAHFSYYKHPIAGDNFYGRSIPRLRLYSQALHAHSLAFVHPKTQQKKTL